MNASLILQDLQAQKYVTMIKDFSPAVLISFLFFSLYLPFLLSFFFLFLALPFLDITYRTNLIAVNFKGCKIFHLTHSLRQCRYPKIVKLLLSFFFFFGITYLLLFITKVTRLFSFPTPPKSVITL